LAWVRAKGGRVASSSPGKRRSRDTNDDRFLAAAWAASAPAVVSHDEDLRVLEKPFGVPILRPPRFLEWCDQAHG
jgi:predicted nucleic acid-binding protein